MKKSIVVALFISFRHVICLYATGTNSNCGFFIVWTAMVGFKKRRTEMSRRSLLAMLLTMIMVVSLAACGGNSDDKKGGITVEDGKLRVAMECGYAPFNWTQLDDSNGAVKIAGENAYANGYDVQIAKKIAESMGLELEIVKLVWESLPPAVDSGSVDLIIAGMSPTEKRRQMLDFADYYYLSDLVIVMQEGSKYQNAKSLADLSGAKITAQLNTFHYDVVEQIPGVQKQAPMEDFPTMRVALQSGAVDGYVSERPEGISASAAMKGITFVGFEDGSGFSYEKNDVAVAPAMKKGNGALLKAVNEALGKISEEERQEIMTKMIKVQPVMDAE